VKRKNFSNISNTFIVVNHTRQFMHTNMYKEICVASFFLFNSFLLKRRTTKVNNKTLAKPIVRRWIFFFGSEQTKNPVNDCKKNGEYTEQAKISVKYFTCCSFQRL